MQIIQGNLLDANTDFIAHQVNCRGCMGSGVALQLYNKYSSYLKNYFITCNAFKDRPECLLGTYIKSDIPGGKAIINIFGQNDYGYNGVKYTDEISFQKAFLTFCYDLPDDRIYTCAIPYKIGCCRGGARWEVISKILENIEAHFSNKIRFIAYKLDE